MSKDLNKIDWDSDWGLLWSKQKVSWQSPMILYEDPFALHPAQKLSDEIIELFKRRPSNESI